jgi:hypothetical protein
VREDGVLVRNNGFTSATRTGVGTFEVEAGQNIVNCSWVGAVGDEITGTGPYGYVRVNRKVGSNTTLNVFVVQGSNQALADIPFHLHVDC